MESISLRNRKKNYGLSFMVFFSQTKSLKSKKIITWFNFPLREIAENPRFFRTKDILLVLAHVWQNTITDLSGNSNRIWTKYSAYKRKEKLLLMILSNCTLTVLIRILKKRESVTWQVVSIKILKCKKIIYSE